MKLTANGSEQMKLLDYNLPPLADGTYEARAVQKIVIDGTEEKTFQKKTSFYVSDRAFTLPQEQIFSVYPHENAVGNFSNELPFIVFNRKTLPWQYDCGGLPRRPWLALIVIAHNEEAVEQDISIDELLSTGGKIFYPSGRQPEHFLESRKDTCHVVDVSRKLYDRIMPKPGETPYLCHGKYVNLADTQETVSSQDGFFSVIMGNRFIPSGESEAEKSSIHLVSLLGCDEPADKDIIRLCSLCHWNVFSQSSKEAGFGELVREIDSRQIGRAEGENEAYRRGSTVKEHRLRTGESTASFYHSPLLPERACKIDMSGRHTADGHLIYDDKKGLFDATYACAWQLGRMITLAREPLALHILKWRRNLAAAAHRRLLRANTAMPDFGDICKELQGIFSQEKEDE